MLQVNNLRITTHKGRVLLEDFDFVLNDNDKIALIGEEGNGKSTILKIMAGEDVSDYVSVSGSVFCDGKIGYLSQMLEEKWFESSVIEYLFRNGPGEPVAPEKYHDYGQLRVLFHQVNADEQLLEQERIMGSLSGGEKVKVQIVKLLYQGADVLLLDEPTNDLDLKTLIWLEEFIKSQSCGIIFVSHDETLLENCSTGILHLEQLKKKTESRLTFSGLNYKDYCAQRYHFVERTNMIARKEKSEFRKQMEKYRQIYQKVEYQQNAASRQDPHGAALLKKKMHAVKALGRNLEQKEKNLTQKFEPEEAIDIFFDRIEINPSRTVIDLHLDALEVDGKILSRNVDLLVKGSDKLCIIGDNGSGKTTLIRIIRDALKDSNLKVGYMPQNYSEVMDYEKTPVDFLLENVPYSKRAQIQSYLGALKFTTEEMTHKISNLSEGQKCKILLVKLIIDKCEVLILDEPTRNLSPLSNPKIREILAEYGGCIISVSHDRKYIEEVCNKICQLEKGGLRKIES
ncbi:MAG: ABC-F family ATP-binding cassette domain-containing protein [Erysipelotrichaceae bacterium]|nr:ABC-F family ATP-binding cassette domain-containing protein [Erysipelotrichaceae bacterium]